MATRKEDIRIVKTKRALTNAFFEILTQIPIDDVTVNELCDRADVRRATFYKHFKDKNDFVVYLIKDIRERFDNEVWHGGVDATITKEYYVQYTEALIDYLLKREAAIKKIVSSHMRSTFINVFLLQNYDDTKRRLEVSIEGGMDMMASADVMASLIVGGIALCIVKWFDKDERESKEEILEDISIFIDRLLA